MQLPKSVLQSDEAIINNVFIEEYEEIFSSILLYNQEEFEKKLYSRVNLNLNSKITKNYEELFSKYKDIYLNIYNAEHKEVANLYDEFCHNHTDDNEENFNVRKIKKNFLPRFLNGEYIRHCKNTKSPLHTCGNALFQISSGRNLYLFCLTCKKVYRPNMIHMLCKSCDTEYYTSIKSSCNELHAATWVKYHCAAIINDIMRCIKCKDTFYLKNDKLFCGKCNFTADPRSIQWTCMICKGDFISDAKPYNPLELKGVKISIKDAVLNSVQAKPKYVKCCTVDIEKTSFYHKKECSGVLFKGILNKKEIVVCSKCRSMNFYDKYIWTCPMCNKRFKQKLEDEYESNLLLSPPMEKSIQDKELNRNNSQMLVLNFASVHGEKNQRSSSKNLEIKLDYGLNCNESSNLKNLAYTPEIRRKDYVSSHNDITPFAIRLMDKIDDHNNHKVLAPILEDEDVIPNKRKIQSPLKLHLQSSPIKKNHTPIKLPSGMMKYSKLLDSFNNEDTTASGSCADQNTCDRSLNSKERDYENQISKIPNFDNKSETFTDFDVDDYKIIKQIGQGSFGKIYEVQRKIGNSISTQKNNCKFAMKKIIAHSIREVKEFKNEYEIINSITTQNGDLKIAKVHGTQLKSLDVTTFALYVLMELAEYDWEHEICKRSKSKLYYKEEELLKILLDLVKTFAKLQKQNVSHRDIKPQNILIYPGNDFKISDFGEAKEIHKSSKINHEQQTIRGTELYMSPILFRTMQEKKNKTNYIEHNTFKSDVFSLGLCFIYAATLTLKSLYDLRELSDMLSIRVTLNRYLKIRYSAKFINIILSMIEINEKERLDFLGLEDYIQTMTR